MSSKQPEIVSEKHERIAYKWKVLMSVIFGIFMVILDTTVVNVAFETLSQEFGATLNDAQWIISIYVLALGISTPLAGFLADRFGIKRTYLSALGTFVLGSFLCGISPNLGFMVAARVLQGLGGGVALPLGVALLMSNFPASEQGMALGIFGIAAIVAPAAGPILGGWLVDQSLWRFIFFINPPIGLLGIVLGSYFLREHTSDRKPPLDVYGLITEIIGFGSILLAASLAANESWTSPDVVVWFVVGVIGLIAFGYVELFVARVPLLDLRLFAKRVFLNASLLGYVSVVALFGAEFLLPIYLQSLRGITAFQTGLILLPMAATGGIATVTAGRLYDRIGPRPLVAVGFSILVVNTWQLSQLQANTPIAWILFLLALRGIALGLTVQTTFVTALSVVQQRDLPRGSALTNATRQVVQSIGVALLATILASTLSPQVQAWEQQFTDVPQQPGTHTIALCDANYASIVNTSGAANKPSGAQLRNAIGLIQEACSESVSGFEKAYTLTFYASFLALALGLMLPGWPFKWGGRRAADMQVSVH